MKQTFYFNTGVTLNEPFGCQIWKGGTIQIPFICEDVPKNAIFSFACDNPNLHPEVGYLVKEILNAGEKGGLISKFAYFKIPA